MRNLPSLNAARAFEAAARSGSFVGAAQELNVTPAAISRMVRLLEDRLGVPLFERKANRLRYACGPYLAGFIDDSVPRSHGRGRTNFRRSLADPAPRRLSEDRT